MNTRRLIWCLCLLAGVAAASMRSGAQQPAPNPNDPRIGLKPGLTDAGVAAWNMELVTNLPKPDAFVDPTGRGSLQYANSDIAFQGAHVFVGSFAGFNFFNVEDPRKARLLLSRVCPGGQGDLSVFGKLMFRAVEETRGRIDCGTQGVTGPVSAERFRGVRIFDISDSRTRRLPRFRRAADRTRTAWWSIRTTRRTSTRIRHRGVRAKNSPAARAVRRTRIRTPRCSASTSSRCR
jgi:hypothetical protein